MTVAPDHSALIAANAGRWAAAKYDAAKGFRGVAQRLCAAKPRYQSVSVTTGVPWFVIAVIHEREASQRWDRNIAQGDRWNAVSVNRPKGRGPFPSWDEAAYDALVRCEPYASAWRDWTPGGTLTLLELYNGEGYELYHHMASPYLWGGSDQYARGKYIADGKFDPNEVDVQLGCAGMLDAMRKLDPSIRFDGEIRQQPAAPSAPAPTQPLPASPQSAPAPGGFIAFLLALVRAIFKRS